MSDTNLNPNFFSILPAPVRYDKKISSTAKVLFSEITALSNVHGYCWAGNNYFAELFDISVTQVSRIIKGLESKGFIKVFVDKSTGNKRKIYPQVIADGNIKGSNVKSLIELFDLRVGNIPTELKEEREAFLEHWMACNEGSKKEAWQKEKTFAVKQRWNTWVRNSRKWNKEKKPLPSDKEIARNNQLEVERKAQEKYQAEVTKERTPEEQAIVNKKLDEMRKGLSNKLKMNV